MAIDLAKKAEKAKIVLAKRNINNIPCEVGLVTDCSGSMEHNFSSGAVQEVVERVLAIAMNVDRDQKVDSWVFDTRVKKVETVTPDIIDGYVNKHVLKKCGWGGTNYAPALSEAMENFFPKKSSGGGFLSGLFNKGPQPIDAPAFIIFITDGDNGDKRDTIKVIEEAQKYNIYFQLVGIGGGSFPFLEKLANDYPNVGYANLTSIRDIDDEDLFELLLNDEFAGWVSQFRV